MLDVIKIKGARQHNLKNISLEIPKNKFVVFTGISGSGKSSLAFDTIYAEGKRRYVESLSAYARQFLGVMDKPDIDSIDGLSPSISIDQKTVSHNPRSTIGTITEIYDYLRVLYARIGHPHCPKCKIEITKLSIDEIASMLLSDILKNIKQDKVKPHRFRIISPVIRQKKGEFKDLFANLSSKGYAKVTVDKSEFKTTDEINLIKTNKHSISVVIDEISVSYSDTKSEIFMSNLKSRLNNSIEQSVSLADGLVLIDHENSELLLSEKFSCPQCGLSLPELEPRMFSFNSPLGACEKCKGIGTTFEINPELVFNKNLSINEGGILPFNKSFFHETWYSRLVKKVAVEEGIDINIAIKDIPTKKLDIILYGTGNNKSYEVIGPNRFGKEVTIHEPFDGIIKEMERKYLEMTGDYVAMEIQKYMIEEICDNCHGKKLKDEILSVTIDSINISEISDLSIGSLLEYFSKKLVPKLNDYERQIATPIITEIISRLTFLDNVGLSYLTISRKAKTLSGGELQRIRLASQIGTGLTGVLYVLDEPSIGLHQKDVSSLIRTLKKLKELGNSLIVVEHDRETMLAADYLVELGPRAGKHGGKVEFSGTLKEITDSKVSLTGQYLSGKKFITRRDKALVSKYGEIQIKGASQFNLKNINARFPIGNLIAVTGVSGSGKSTLIVETLYPALRYYLDGHYNESIGSFERLEGYHYIDRVYLVDQSPIGRTPRSNPATYVGFFDEIRNIFAETVDAKAKGFQKGRFSFNIKGGRCEKCQGAGLLKIEMQFLADVYVKCDVCQGRRYNHETLEVRFKGKTIYDILKMTVDEATDFFKNHFKIGSKLNFLKEVGLGYVELGQAATTFSGGEAQRIKLANELSKRESGRTIYILDEPTTGLHFYDIEKLMGTLYQLVDRGNTVIIIEHNLDVIKNCQYVIDLGPDGGNNGGKIVYQGETKGILKTKQSYTGQYLRSAN